MQKNVLHLLGSVTRGGAEFLILDLARLTNQLNDGHYHFAFYGSGALEQSFLEFQNCEKIESRHKIQMISGLRSLIRRQNIQIIHCHSSMHVIYARLASIGYDVKIVYTVHGFGKSIRSKFLNKMAVRFSEKVLFVSGSVKKRLSKIISKRFQNKCMVMYNGINTHKINFTKRDRNKSDKMNLGMVGNFHTSVRDQFTLCETALILKKKKIPFELYFVGGAAGNETERLERCKAFVNKNSLDSQVHFLGFKDNVPEYLHKWDVFVYSSNHDTFGIAVVEAIMSGIPVLVNDLDVFTEITENGRLATLFKTKDPEDAAEKIVDFYQNPQPYFEKAEKGAKLAREKYSIERHYQNLNQLYSSL